MKTFVMTAFKNLCYLLTNKSEEKGANQKLKCNLTLCELFEHFENENYLLKSNKYKNFYQSVIKFPQLIA